MAKAIRFDRILRRLNDIKKILNAFEKLDTDLKTNY